MSEQPKKLICTRESIMPGRGHFKPGDIITDPDLIAVIGSNHPSFIVGDDVPSEPEMPKEEESNQEGN